MTAEECLRRSDIAMYAAKRAGRNCQVWFDQKMERELCSERSWKMKSATRSKPANSFRSISPRSTSEPDS